MTASHQEPSIGIEILGRVRLGFISSAREVEGIAAALEPFRFDTIYGHFFDRVVPAGAKEILQASVARYLAAIKG